MKVGVFSPYLNTMGGGERYLLSVAQFFLSRKHQVNLFWPDSSILSQAQDRFGLDLSGVRVVPSDLATMGLIYKFFLSRNYDLLFYLSDGSIPSLFARENILHFQTPFHYTNQQTFVNKVKLRNIKLIVCNSNFTKHYIDRTYGVNAAVIYPPVDVANFKTGKKENVILSVGRFFAPSHPKKQEVLIETFKRLVEAGLVNWKLILVGGTTLSSEQSVNELKKMSAGYPIEIITDVDFALLQKNYAQAKIYWHAAGFDENVEKFPEKAEHFGMTTVEAMAAGCVPLVFAAGGQKEIVTEGGDGFFWQTTEELCHWTKLLISDSRKLNKLSRQAISKAQMFSKERFFEELEKRLL